MLRHRSCSCIRYAAVLAATVLILAACSDAAFQSEQPAYPTFSLVGAPERDVTFDLSVFGPGMQPIGPIEVGPEQGSTVLEVPAGRNREFHFAARDDVYSGRATTSIAGGSETTVTVPIVPGPVFPTLLQDGDFSPRIVQIRDFDADSQSGMVRSLDTTERSIDVEFADDGTLWTFAEVSDGKDSNPAFVQYHELVPYGHDLVIRYNPSGEPALGQPTAMAVDSSNERLAVAAVNDLGAVELYAENLTEFEFSLESGIELAEMVADHRIHYVTGLSFVSTGELYALGLIGPVEGLWENAEVAVFQIELGSTDSISYEIVPVGQSPQIYDSSETPWGDVRVVGDSVYVVSAAARAGDPAVFEYDLDLNLVDEWGTITTADDPVPGEFWGPRRFAATRDPEELIVIDQKDGDQGGIGRLIRFEFGETDGWQEFGRDEYEFFQVDPEEEEDGDPVNGEPV